MSVQAQVEPRSAPVRNLIPVIVAVLYLGAVLRAGNEGPASPSQPTTAPAIDLSKNQLVQKAMADHEKAVAEADADYQKKLDALNVERQKKLDAAKVTCVAALRRAETVANTLKKTEEGLTIKALADSIAADVPQIAPAGVPRKGDLFAVADDAYDLYINGKPVLSGKDWSKPQSASVSVSKGDVITVRCDNSLGLACGFAAVLKYNTGGSINTSLTNWYNYTPVDATKWYDVKGIGAKTPVQKGDNKDLAKEIAKAANLNVTPDNIWGKGTVCYLTFTVP